MRMRADIFPIQSHSRDFTQWSNRLTTVPKPPCEVYGADLTRTRQ
ncbi:hypothetical protein TPY_1893 [Sulfobacillus acidophilus TPY]|nr:hypothetical protein TPY_1893 [Sulfobacillus acidophilus TPY]